MGEYIAYNGKRWRLSELEWMENQLQGLIGGCTAELETIEKEIQHIKSPEWRQKGVDGLLAGTDLSKPECEERIIKLASSEIRHLRAKKRGTEQKREDLRIHLESVQGAIRKGTE